MSDAAERMALLLREIEAAAADTMVFIYHLQDHPRYAALTQCLFEAWEQGTVRGITSTLTLLELLVKPLRDGEAEVARDYLRLVTTYPNLSLVPVDEAVAAEAAELRARHNVPTPDAIQVATALRAGAALFVTNDRSLTRIGERIRVLVLDDLLASAEAGRSPDAPASR